MKLGATTRGRSKVTGRSGGKLGFDSGSHQQSPSADAETPDGPPYKFDSSPGKGLDQLHPTAPLNSSLGGLETEAQNQQTLQLDLLATLEIVRAIHAADREALAAVEHELGAISSAIDKITARVQAGGRLFYLGAGTSGRLGVLDAAECPPTFNSPPELVQGLIAGGDTALRQSIEDAEDDPRKAQEDLTARGFTAADTLVGIAASGRTPYVLGGIAYARDLGAWTIGLSCVRDSALELAADQSITPVTGPEVVTGSTRMKAGTATKLVLNMLSTGAMVKLGYVYGNLMVNVQPTNAKLRDRALRIIAKLTGLSLGGASSLLHEAGSVRVAIVMHRLSLGPNEAAARLAAVGGRLRDVVGSGD
jgi:N-acetylmuramic acid 6-phosphate etherase